MKIIFALLSVLLFVTLSYSQGNKTTTPYRTVKLKDNLFIDQYEVSFSWYIQYCWWIKFYHTENSPEFRSALPIGFDKCPFHLRGDKYSKDTLLREWLGCYTMSYECSYNRLFEELPVVGISFEQAISFCKWRSNLSYQHLLLMNKLILQTDSWFTIEDVLNGKIQILDTVKLKTIPIPIFRLPTAEEWELAASGGLNMELFPYGVEKQNIIRNEIHHDTLGVVKINILERTKPNKYRLYNMIGNVSEMVSVKGISKGGSWNDDNEACKIKNSKRYDQPEPWLGFRCVYELKKIE